SVVTDLTVTGKVAQFGRGVMADVSAKLMDQFVQTLEADVLSGGAPEPSNAPVRPGPAGPRRIESKPAEPVNLLGAAGSPVVKRLAPPIVAVVAVLWLARRRTSRRRSSRS